MKRFLTLIAVIVLTAIYSYSQLKNEAINDKIILSGSEKFNNTLFIENKGQWNSQAMFLTRSAGLNAWVTKEGIVYDFFRIEKAERLYIPGNSGQHDPIRRSGHVVYMKFSESLNSHTVGTDQQEAYYNYFLGSDASKWAENVQTYSSVTAEDIYPGISARYYYDQDGLRYDIVLSPGADIGQMQIVFEGTDGLSINRKGELLLNTSLGKVVQKKLFAYQEKDGKKNEVKCRFVIKDDGKVGFISEWPDKTQQLIIDPLIYSTFIGSTDLDQINDVAQDASGTLITGKTYTAAYPTTTGAYDVSFNGYGDAFITKLNTTGTSLLFSTYLGGNSDDEGNSVAIAQNGTIYFAGTTSSANFPVTSGVYDETFNHSSSTHSDCCIAKLSENGNNLNWSTYFGGSYDSDFSSRIAIDQQGKPTLLGHTYSSDLYVSPGCYDNTFNGVSDVFIARFSSDASSVAFSTFVGGSDSDIGYDLYQDINSVMYVTGITSSGNFPVTSGAYDNSYNDFNDAFVFKINSNASSLVYSTYIGGNNMDIGLGIAVDANGNAIITGSTTSGDYPVTNGAYSTAHSNMSYSDVFVTKFTASGGSLSYSTFVGGYNDDCGNAVTIDGSGNAIVTGYSTSSDFPMVSYAYDNSHNGLEDVIVFKLNFTGTALLYSTFLGGSGSDTGTGLVIESGSNVFIAGNTGSVNYPVTTDAFDISFNDLNFSIDGFVTKLQFYPPPQVSVSSSGNATCYGGNNGFINISVTGGITPYTFLWSNGATTEDNNNIPSGNYSVTVSDLLGSTSTASSTITQPSALSATATITNSNCVGCSNGAIDLTVNGGTSPYSYSWSNNSTNQDLVNIQAGLYKLTVTDIQNCTTTGNYTVNVYYQLQASVTKSDVSCFGGNNGSVDLTLNNGTSPFVFHWSNGQLNEDIGGLVAGNYSVTVSDVLSFSTTASITISQPATLSASGDVTNVSCNGCSNGMINPVVAGGTTPYIFNWSNGTTSMVLSNVPVGNYQVTVTDFNNCSVTSGFTVALVYQPGWSYTVTSTNHSIMIQYNTSITINNIPVEIGDYIGVFYNDSVTLHCGGYMIWQGVTNSIAAWSDDQQTTNKDGFLGGETFKWKIFDTSTGIEYVAQASYLSGFPNTGTFAINGMSVVSNINTATTHTINLPVNWSIFSTYINTLTQDVSVVLASVSSSVIIVKDDNGNVWWPVYTVNNIGSMTIGKGYQIKLSSAQVLSIQGMAAVPEATPLNVGYGWSIIGYLRQSQALIADLLSSVVNNIQIVKDGDGNVYWPEFTVNLIVNMGPGKGYQMKATAPFILTYPAN